MGGVISAFFSTGISRHFLGSGLGSTLFGGSDLRTGSKVLPTDKKFKTEKILKGSESVSLDFQAGLGRRLGTARLSQLDAGGERGGGGGHDRLLHFYHFGRDNFHRRSGIATVTLRF